MPGSNARALEKARGLPADALILDLEDAVAPEQKELAREQVCAALQTGFGKRTVMVRINALDSAWGNDDLVATTAEKPDAILIPKVTSAADIHRAELHLARIAGCDAIKLWAMIETPQGVLKLPEIAAAGGGLAGLILGTNDLIKELGATHSKDRSNLFYVLGQTVLAARANGLAVIDGVHNDITDTDDFAFACAQARSFGFDGKTLIHPSQIDVCNAAFAPTQFELAAARAIVAAFQQPENQGKGAIKVDGRMVERLHEEMAKRTLALAAAIAAL